MLGIAEIEIAGEHSPKMSWGDCNMIPGEEKTGEKRTSKKIRDKEKQGYKTHRKPEE